MDILYRQKPQAVPVGTGSEHSINVPAGEVWLVSTINGANLGGNISVTDVKIDGVSMANDVIPGLPINISDDFINGGIFVKESVTFVVDNGGSGDENIDIVIKGVSYS